MSQNLVLTINVDMVVYVILTPAISQPEYDFDHQCIYAICDLELDYVSMCF